VQKCMRPSICTDNLINCTALLLQSPATAELAEVFERMT
jgi:hypothetical protein